MKIDPSRLHNIGRGGVGRVSGEGLGATDPVRESAASQGMGGADQLELSSRAEEMKAALNDWPGWMGRPPNSSIMHTYPRW